MHWRITLEAIDPLEEGYRKEFMIEKDLDGLADGKLGCSIEDGKAIMKEVQKIIVERQLDLWVRYCRVGPFKTAGSGSSEPGRSPPENHARLVDLDHDDLYCPAVLNGPYRFSVRDAADASYEETPAAVYALVSEVRAGDDGLVFTLPGGIEVPFSEVTGVRAGV